MMTYEERKQQLLENVKHRPELVRTTMSASLKQLENWRNEDATPEILALALANIADITQSPETVQGLIDYFWNEKMHRAVRIVNELTGSIGLIKGRAK